MHSGGLPHSHKQRLSPEPELAQRDGISQVSLLGNVKLFIGSVRFQCKLEITKVDGRQLTATVPEGRRIRRQRRRRVSTSDNLRSSRSNALDPSHQDRALRFYRQHNVLEVLFWEALDSAQREALWAISFSRTFATGARLMWEGDAEGHVIVVLGGQTGICVKENGSSYMMTETSPSQLVGELGALQVSLRSASVVALETVQALVVRKSDFTAFIGTHPAVLEFMESHSHSWLGGRPTGLPQSLNGENCTVIVSDVVGFGAVTRTDEDRRVIREALFSMTQSALRNLPDVWAWDDRGDGLLTIVPPSIPTALVIRHLHKELHTALEEHNLTHRDQARIQLRVAINVGPVATDNMGVSGESIIVTTRLVEAPLFKEAMAEGQADLGIIASTFIYDNVIRHDLGLSGYSQVQATIKESRLQAWMKLFGPPAESGQDSRKWLGATEGPRAGEVSGPLAVA